VVKPALAHTAIERGEIRVVAPTLLTLEDLAESHARHGGLDAMLAAERGRSTPPVMPRIEVCPDEVRVVMPWDPATRPRRARAARRPVSSRRTCCGATRA